MKKIILALFVFLSMGSFAFAQNANATPASAKPKFLWTAEAMNSAEIPADVQPKITELLRVAEDASALIRKDKSVQGEERKEKLKVIRTACDTDINALLTKEQKKKIGELRKAAQGN